MLFDRSIQELTAVIYYTGLRHRVVANNIANADTPNYKALDISFKQQLDDLINAMEHKEFESSHSESNSITSQSTSLPPPTVIFTPDIYGVTPRIDNNTVNLDLEMIKLSQNSILHNVFLQLLNSKFRVIKTAINGNV